MAKQFRKGQRYSRQEISDAIGGSPVHYLPYRDGEILCGCFDPRRSFNPGAPDEVIYGSNPVVSETARMVADQAKPIPIFMRRAPGQWEYIGEYRCVKRSTNALLVEEKRKAFPQRRGIAGVLYFEKV